MRILDNGTYRDMTEEEVAELKELRESFKPSVEKQVEEVRENLKELKELFTPLLKMLGGNK